jgi:hypothetical protein
MELIDSCFLYGGKIDKKARRVGYLMQIFELPNGKFKGRYAKAIELWSKGNRAGFEEIWDVMPWHSYPFDHPQDARNWAYKQSEHRIKRWKKTHLE